MKSVPPSGFIPPHGHYQELLSYRKAEVAYDPTFRFCERFIRRGDRTIDQMVQAARSGKQNITEGSRAAGTLKEMEVKLTNVACASLEELLVAYQDFLRVRDWRLWPKASKGVVANIAICLIHQTNYLLDQQIRWLEQDFLKEGGRRERMTRARLQERKNQK